MNTIASKDPQEPRISNGANPAPHDGAAILPPGGAGSQKSEIGGQRSEVGGGDPTSDPRRSRDSCAACAPLPTVIGVGRSRGRPGRGRLLPGRPTDADLAAGGRSSSDWTLNCW